MKTKIRCKCGHVWMCSSLNLYVTCPSCMSKIKREKYRVIELEGQAGADSQSC